MSPSPSCVKIIVKRVKQFAKKVKPHNKRAPTTRSKQKVILEKVAEASKKKRKESEEFRMRDEPSNVEIWKVMKKRRLRRSL